MRIASNVPALGIKSLVDLISSRIEKNSKKLSTGHEFETILDDSSNYAIYRRRDITFNDLTNGVKALNEGLGWTETLDAGLEEADQILQDMRSLILQTRNSTMSTVERGNIKDEVFSLSKQFGDVLENIQYNGKNILQTVTDSSADIDDLWNTGNIRTFNLGSFATNDDDEVLVIQHGTQISANTEDIIFDINDLAIKGASTVGATDSILTDYIASALETYSDNGESYGVFDGGAIFEPFTQTATSDAVSNLSETALISRALLRVDYAIHGLNNFRTDIARVHNQIESKITIRQTELNALEASQAARKDVDMSAEIIDFTSNQIIQQVGLATLAQANLQTQNVLQLLK